MPRTYDEILEEILMNAEGPAATLMENPSQMQDTMNRGAPVPNQDQLLNPQMYDTMRPPERQDALMNPGFMLDKVDPDRRMEDTQTGGQTARDRTKRAEAFIAPQTPVINPDGTAMDELFPPPPPRNMREMYENMPMQQPKSRMPQISPDFLTEQYAKQQDMQSGNSTMQELMDFYTQGGQDI